MNLKSVLELEGALAVICKAAHVLEDDWWIIGSAAAALQGADIGAMADIDLLTSSNDARRLCELWQIEPLPPSGSIQFRSRIHAIKPTAGLSIDLMAELDCHDGQAWRRVMPVSRMPVRSDDRLVYTPGITDQIRIMRLFGRSKDLQRAAALEALGGR